MKQNVGSIDKVIRIILAVGIASLYFLLEGGMKNLAFIAVVPLLTSAISFCPLYAILGINTCPMKKE